MVQEYAVNHVLFLSLKYLFASFAYAQERATKTKAMALLQKAVALIKAKGEKAYPQLQDPKGKFVVKDLYIYVSTLDNFTLLVHPFYARDDREELVGFKRC